MEQKTTTELPKEKNDIRFLRTEHAIRGAFSDLYSRKPMNEITVKELCSLAGINKSTFYLHYHDIYELESQLGKLIIDNILSIFMDYPYQNLLANSTEIWSRIIQLFDGKEPLCISVSQTPQLANLLSMIDGTIISLLTDSLKEKQPELSEESLAVHRMLLTFIVNGYIGLIRKYTPQELTPETMHMLSDYLQNGFPHEKGHPSFRSSIACT